MFLVRFYFRKTRKLENSKTRGCASAQRAHVRSSFRSLGFRKTRENSENSGKRGASTRSGHAFCCCVSGHGWLGCHPRGPTRTGEAPADGAAAPQAAQGPAPRPKRPPQAGRASAGAASARAECLIARHKQSSGAPAAGTHVKLNWVPQGKAASLAHSNHSSAAPRCPCRRPAPRPARRHPVDRAPRAAPLIAALSTRRAHVRAQRARAPRQHLPDGLPHAQPLCGRCRRAAGADGRVGRARARRAAGRRPGRGLGCRRSARPAHRGGGARG